MAAEISSAREVTPEWLTEVLHAHGSLKRGRVAEVTTLSMQQLKHCVAIQLVARYVDASDDAPSRLFLKMARLDVAPETSGFGRKEIRFYQDLAPATPGLPVLRLHHADYSPQTGHWHLLLDDLSDTHWTPASLPPGKSLCQKAVEVLACLHASWWENPRLDDVTQRPSEEMAVSTFARTEPHLGVFIDYLGERLSPEWRKTCERIFASAPSLFAQRVTHGRGLTLIHGDNHHLNHLYPHDAAHGEVYIVDWPSYNCWIGADDLAYMMALNWFPECRAAMERDLVRHYYDALLAFGLKGYTWDDCWYDYRLSVIRMFCIPIRQWAKEMAPWLWYNNLECATAAFRDLQCEELLSQ